MRTRTRASTNADSLSLDHMRAFLAFVETGGQQRAARNLGVAQATVWRHVDRVQQHFGGGLFETKAGARLSSRGLLVERTLRSILQEVEGIRVRLACERPLLRIGFVRIMRPIVERALREASAKGQKLEFEVRLFELRSEQQARKLQRHELDVAVCYAMDRLFEDRTGIDESLVTEQPYLLVVPERALTRGKVLPSGLTPLQYVRLPAAPSSETATLCLRWLEQRGLSAEPSVDCKLGTEIIAYAASGRGYGFLPALWRTTEHQGAAFVRLSDLGATSRIVTYSLQHVTPRVASFVRSLQRVAALALRHDDV